jgi:hypothetical protein
MVDTAVEQEAGTTATAAVSRHCLLLFSHAKRDASKCESTAHTQRLELSIRSEGIKA